MKLASNGLTIGTWQQIPNTSISEILANSGYDWIAVDLEHGAINISQLPDICRAILMNEVLPLARISSPNSTSCKLALDAGMGGLIIPNIESKKQLSELVSASCWPPSGSRGVGYSSANLFGKKFNNYNKEAQNPLIIAQIESTKAVQT